MVEKSENCRPCFQVASFCMCAFLTPPPYMISTWGLLASVGPPQPATFGRVNTPVLCGATAAESLGSLPMLIFHDYHHLTHHHGSGTEKVCACDIFSMMRSEQHRGRSERRAVHTLVAIKKTFRSIQHISARARLRGPGFGRLRVEHAAAMAREGQVEQQPAAYIQYYYDILTFCNRRPLHVKRLLRW
jgi:hypothetical protein